MNKLKISPIKNNKRSSSISLMDIGLVFGIPLTLLTAWCLPKVYWKSLANFLSPHFPWVLSQSQNELSQRINRALGTKQLPLQPQSIAHQLATCEIVRNFQTMRDYRPGNWCPKIEVIGQEHIKMALSIGRGAIIWDSQFYFANLVTKMGLHRIGFKLHHLSHPEHGFSSTTFGIRYLNPIRSTIENRYLAERILINPNNPGKVLPVLKERLHENKLVSISVSNRGNRTLQMPFLNTSIQIAPGAQKLAVETGAALIPVFTTSSDNVNFQVIVEPPLIVPEPTNISESITILTQQYIKRLAPKVLENPGEWLGWMHIR